MRRSCYPQLNIARYASDVLEALIGGWVVGSRVARPSRLMLWESSQVVATSAAHALERAQTLLSKP